MPTRMRYSLTALVILIPAIVEAQEESAAAGVIFQDSFEKGTRTPDGWKSGAQIAGVKYVYDKKRGATGSRSLSLQKSAQRFFPIAQWFRIIPAPKSRTIHVSAKIRAKEASKAILDVQFLDQKKTTFQHKWVAYIGAKKASDKPVTHDWKDYGDSVDVPPNTKSILVGLQIYGPGQVWFDDVMVKEAGEANASIAPPAPSKNVTKININGADAEYIYAAPGKQDAAKPHGLLIVMPGGDGSVAFHPFVRSIHQHTAGDDFALAQPIAKKWTPGQKIVWPKTTDKVSGMKYSTEEMINAVVNDVNAKIKLDHHRVFVLAWSSGGPAAYATLLQKQSPVAGGLIAMSVFRPDTLPPLSAAAGKKFYLLHSPQDRVCPHWMAKQAEQELKANSGQVTLVNYEGGHGWHGDVFANISSGMRWLSRMQ